MKKCLKCGVLIAAVLIPFAACNNFFQELIPPDETLITKFAVTGRTDPTIIEGEIKEKEIFIPWQYEEGLDLRGFVISEVTLSDKAELLPVTTEYIRAAFFPDADEETGQIAKAVRDLSDPSVTNDLLAGLIRQNPDFRMPALSIPLDFSGQGNSITLLVIGGKGTITRYTATIEVAVDFEYELNGGKWHEDTPEDHRTPTAIYSRTLTEPDPEPVKDGYFFDGWYREPELAEPAWDFAVDLVGGDMKLYAKWVPWITVTFETYGLGDTSPPDGQLLKPGETIERPPNPAATGYGFFGWYTADGTEWDGAEWDFDTGVTEDLTLYAKWIENIYNVVFILGDDVYESEQVRHGESINTEAPPIDSHEFIGWYRDPDFSPGSLWDEDEPVTGDLILYARYVAMYTVTFYTGTETFVQYETVTVEEGKTVTEPNEPDSPDGKIFGGWFTEWGNKWDFNTPITGDTTLYARYTRIYTVTFYTGTGTSVPDQTVEEGKPVTEPNDPDSPDGTYFDGWFKEPEGIIKWDFNTPITGDTTLYAKWVEWITVTFDINGFGHYTPDPVQLKSGERIEKPTPDPEEPGFDFGGWYTEPEGIIKWDFNTPITESMTLYAKWINDLYTVTFVTFYSEYCPPEQVSYGASITRKASPKDYYGRDFIGWYTSYVFSDENYWPEDKPVTEDLILYAKYVWMYTVTFDMGTPEPHVVLVEEGKPITMTDIPDSPDGTIFYGWFREPTWINEWDFNTPITGDTTLYVKYMYTVTFEPTGGATENLTAIYPAEIDPQYIPHGERISEPTNPVRASGTRLNEATGKTEDVFFVFGGWFLEPDLINLWNFVYDVVTEDMTLYARWIQLIMAPITAGSFKMGSEPGDLMARENEDWIDVTLTDNFYMGIHQVTEELYYAVYNYFLISTLPMTHITWYEAGGFIDSLNAILNTTFRLPTEAEWEYACRANADPRTRYNTGRDTIDPYEANFNNTNTSPVNVGSYAPNPWGLYDMHGNVSEWCQDWHDLYADQAATDPTRVSRGGSFNSTAQDIRSASRQGIPPNQSRNDHGFRLVR